MDGEISDIDAVADLEPETDGDGNGDQQDDEEGEGEELFGDGMME